MLKQWMTGCLVKGTKQFSADNYKNHKGLIEMPKEPSKPTLKRKTYMQKIIHCTDFFTENIEVFKEHHWKTILDEVLRLMPDKLRNKWGVAIAKATSQDEFRLSMLR